MVRLPQRFVFFKSRVFSVIDKIKNMSGKKSRKVLYTIPYTNGRFLWPLPRSTRLTYRCFLSNTKMNLITRPLVCCIVIPFMAKKGSTLKKKTAIYNVVLSRSQLPLIWYITQTYNTILLGKNRKNLSRFLFFSFFQSEFLIRIHLIQGMIRLFPLL